MSVLTLLAFLGIGLALNLPIVSQVVVGSVPYPNDKFLSIPRQSSLFASCLTNVSLLFSDATTVPPITTLNRTAMASAGWQTFTCTSVPQALAFSAARRIMEVPSFPNRLYIGASKRAFNDSLLFSNSVFVISSAFDLCALWYDADFVLTWDNPNVQGLLNPIQTTICTSHSF